MHHIVDMRIAAHGIAPQKGVVVQPGEILRGQPGLPAPGVQFGGLDEFAVSAPAFKKSLLLCLELSLL